MVSILINGTTSAGVSFAMTAERATIMDGGECGLAPAFDIPYVMPGKLYVQSYRYVAWKVPPFMPAGTYTVQIWPFQTNGSTPRYFGAARRNYAQGTLTVGTPNVILGSLQLPTVPNPPTTANPVFTIGWQPTSFFSSNGTLRTTIQNVSTNRYYCLSTGNAEVGNSPSVSSCSGYPCYWDANALAINTGSGVASVRYNSTMLFGGQRLVQVPAGTYRVFLDEVSQAQTSANKYLVTTTGQTIVLP